MCPWRTDPRSLQSKLHGGPGPSLSVELDPLGRLFSVSAAQLPWNQGSSWGTGEPGPQKPTGKPDPQSSADNCPQKQNQRGYVWAFNHTAHDQKSHWALDPQGHRRDFILKLFPLSWGQSSAVQHLTSMHRPWVQSLTHISKFTSDKKKSFGPF